MELCRWPYNIILLVYAISCWVTWFFWTQSFMVLSCVPTLVSVHHCTCLVVDTWFNFLFLCLVLILKSLILWLVGDCWWRFLNLYMYACYPFILFVVLVKWVKHCSMCLWWFLSSRLLVLSFVFQLHSILKFCENLDLRFPDYETMYSNIVKGWLYWYQDFCIYTTS